MNNHKNIKDEIKKNLKISITFQHPLDTSEGRIERAIYILLDNSGFPIPVKLAFLAAQIPKDELQSALDLASEEILNRFCCDRCGH